MVIFSRLTNSKQYSNILPAHLLLPLASFEIYNTVLTYHYTGSHQVFSTINQFSEKITKILFFTLTQSM